MKRWGWTGQWILILLVCSIIWTMDSSAVQAAGANLSIETDANPVVAGEIFYVIITITSTEKLSGFEGHFTYDQGAMKYLTGGSVSNGNDDSFSISDKDRETPSNKLKYSIQFRARRAGNSTISLKSPYGIYGGEDSGKLSVAYSPLHIRVLSKKQAQKQEEREGQSEIPEEIGDRPGNETDGQEPPDIPDGTGIPGEDGGREENSPEKELETTLPQVFPDLIPEEETGDFREPDENVPDMGQSENGDAKEYDRIQWKKRVSILVLLLAVVGLFFLILAFWRRWEETAWEDMGNEDDDYDYEDNREEKYKEDVQEEEQEIDPGEELTEEEIQKRMEIIEQRLEQKRQWYPKGR